MSGLLLFNFDFEQKEHGLKTLERLKRKTPDFSGVIH
ncbi:MAG: hypothetical protein RLZ28_345 [Actinomycetota bacterium]|jgi:hypothetical protein